MSTHDEAQSPEQPASGRQSARIGEPVPPEGPSSAARSAGRGFLLITGAKVWFMMMGAIVSIGLPALMAPDDFGVYSIVTNVMSLINMVIITGTIQAVSKLVSEQPAQGLLRVKHGLLLQLVVGVPIGLVYIAVAPVVAGLFNDPSLTPLLRVSGGVIVAYSFYAVFVGYLNGVEAFGRQALLDVTFATLKTGLIMGAVLVGFGVIGAVWGFVSAGVCIVLIAPVVVWHERNKGGYAARAVPAGATAGQVGKLAKYLVLVMLFTFAINGVLRVDLFLLKSLTEPVASIDADALAGVYAAMLNLSRLPYQSVIAVTFVVFPMISKATFEDDLESTRSYIRSTLRYSTVLLALLGTLLAAEAADVIDLLYGSSYADGAGPLGLMSLATVAFALFFISTAMITGAGRPLASFGLAVAALVATALFDWVLISAALATDNLAQADLLMAASSGTAAAMVLGCVSAIVYLVVRFGAGLSLPTLGRVGLASAIVWTAVGLLPEAEAGKVVVAAVVAGKGILGVALFVGVLWGLGEVTSADRTRVLSLIQRKGANDAPEQ